MALVRKEFNQIRRDRRLAFSLIVPPILQLTLFGFALSATVTNLRLGVVDESNTPESRELVARLTESKSFRLGGDYFSADELGSALGQGKLDAGVVIPYHYARDLQRGRSAKIQFLLNAINANTATIGQGYAEGVIQSYNNELQGLGVHASFRTIAAAEAGRQGKVQLTSAYLYNPGLVDSWFIATGVLGLLLISPASTTEIILAKIAPLFLLLCMMMVIAILVLKTAFGVPFHGSLLFVSLGGVLCILAGIGIGTVLATFSKSAQQAQLTAFFVNPPLSSLSGALNPVEAMPHWLRPVTLLNPIHHFANIARGGMLKGSGFDALWPNFLALSILTVVLLALSIWRFRKQLS